MNKILTLTVLALALLCPPAQAGEESTYSPEYCEFSATFPEAPYTSRKCDAENKDQCYDLISFTQVFELDTTVNFRVICNKISGEVHENYSGKIMEATLRAMTEDTVIETFNTTFREEEDFKQAGLVGEGKVGRTSTLYIAQLWIGKQSAMSVEAEIIGDSAEEADELFRDVLRSIGHKSAVAEETSAEAPEEPAKEN